MGKEIVGIRFQKIGKMYHFDATGFDNIQSGDFVVVNTSRGQQLGEVVGLIENPPKPPKGTWKRIERRATPKDLLIKQSWEEKEIEVLNQCRAQVMDKGIEGLKIVSVEFSFDGEMLTILFSTEEDSEINLSPILEDLSKSFPEIKVEFRRIGPRDVAKIIGGMGACGMEVRCCSTFLDEFCPISIKMAKTQSVSLDPSEITGMCGRLRCCLMYEYELYIEARKELPKRGTWVDTPDGEGKVVDALPLKQMVVVRLDDENKTRVEFSLDDVKPKEILEAPHQKAQESGEEHRGRGRDGKRKRSRKQKK